MEQSPDQLIILVPICRSIARVRRGIVKDS
jgi:hypothetical protein